VVVGDWGSVLFWKGSKEYGPYSLLNLEP